MMTESCHSLYRQIYADPKMRVLYHGVDMLKQREQLIKILMIICSCDFNEARLRQQFVTVNENSLLKGSRWHFDIFLKYLEHEWQCLEISRQERIDAIRLIIKTFGGCFKKQPVIRGLIDLARTGNYKHFRLCCTGSTADEMMRHWLHINFPRDA